MLDDAAAKYDPSIHEAPIVVGHPKDNGPAFGWVRSLTHTPGEGIDAEPGQVNPEFSELVAAGSYKKVSASWYLPDSPANPVPGTLYLRHVGFLGGQPPAIKGLRGVEFTEAEEGVVEFSEPWTQQTVASLFRRMREWMIGRWNLEEADKAIPAFAVEDLEASARRAIEQPPEPTPADNPASFNEPAGATMPPADNTPNAGSPTASPGTNQPAAAPAVDFAERERQVAEREQRVAEQERALAVERHTAFIDGLVKEGRVLPRERAGLISFMASLEPGVVEFSETDGQSISKDRLEVFKESLKARPVAVEFQERSADPTAGADNSQAKVDPNKVRDYVEDQRSKGNHVSYAQALDAVYPKKAGAQ